MQRLAGFILMVAGALGILYTCFKAVQFANGALPDAGLMGAAFLFTTGLVIAGWIISISA